MGRITEFGEEEATSSSSSSPSLCEALLFTTMYIVGLPVEVHIKDGSIFSGIFHTASLDEGYGVVLKKARMIRKGTLNANVPSGALIETLVVRPKDLVQVVAKGVMLPSGTGSSAASHNDGEAVLTGTTSQPVGNEAVVGEVVNQEREVGVDRPQDEEDDCNHPSESVKEAPEVIGSSTSSNGCCSELNVQKEHHIVIASNQLPNGTTAANDASPDIKLINQFHDTHLSKEFMRMESVASGVSVSESVKPESNAAQNLLVNRTAKESKLNPGAKVFSPSLPSLRSTPPLVPTVPSMAYVPNSIPAVQVAAAQPEVGTRPIPQRSSWPIKVFPYVNSTPTNTDNGLQYGQQIAGHIATRAQSIRHGAQYQPIQAVPSYIHPSPQNAMFGRPGQVVYVHPITHDVIQGPAAFSQAPHPMLASHSIHLAKHEGFLAGQALPVSATPPLVTNVPQPFAMPGHIQFSQPLFSSMLPLPVLSSNVPYGAKFP